MGRLDELGKYRKIASFLSVPSEKGGSGVHLIDRQTDPLPLTKKKKKKKEGSREEN